MTLKNHGWWLAPDGAEPAVSRACSTTARATGRSEKSRTVRRAPIRVRKAETRARLVASSIAT